MRSKAIVLALLALAFEAQAASVSQSDAVRAARNWAKEGLKMGHRLSSEFREVKAHTNDVPFYEVRLGRGTVFVSGDTEIEPILAFVPSSGGDDALDEKSPLAALLRRDLAARSRKAAKSPGRVSRLLGLSSQSSTPQPKSIASQKWARLLASSKPRLLGAAAPIDTADDLDDLRVAPLVQTQWGQDYAYMIEEPEESEESGVEPTEGEGVPEVLSVVNCFNYYTPTVEVEQYEDPYSPALMTNENCVCGCVATAMAQLMRYWEWPKREIAPFDNAEFQVAWQSAAVMRKTDERLGLTIWEELSASARYSAETLAAKAGVYDWANMVDGPLVESEINCKAIGKLTYDCGVSVGMEYGLLSSGVPSDKSARIPAALTNRFGYANARLCQANLTVDEVQRRRAMYANFDAGCPTLLLISGNRGGHAVVGDGYGFNGEEKTPYVHLNMGWSGQNDVWYNLPAIDTGNNPEQFEGFDTIDGAVYNVFAATSGVEVVSGRLVSPEGTAVTNAVVSLYDGESLLAQTNSSETGVYAFFVKPGKSYEIRAKATREGGTETAVAKTVTPVIAASTGDQIGNVWGLDMTLGFAVRIGELAYPTLDAALAAAKDGDMLEVLAATELTETLTVTGACTIVAATDDPAECLVKFGADVGLVVAKGGSLMLTNVVLSLTNEVSKAKVPAVSVDAGGRLTVAGVVDFRMPEGAAAVATADSSGLAIAGDLSVGFLLDCAEAVAIGDVFGCVQKDIPLDAASRAVAAIFNAKDENLRGRAVETERGIVLKWDAAATPFDTAVCYFVEKDGVTTNLAQCVDDGLLRLLTADEEGRIGEVAELVIRTNATLTGRFTVGRNVRLRGEGEEPVVLAGLADDAGFDVTAGTQEVENVAIDGYKGSGLFVIDGEAAALRLVNCAVTDAVGTSGFAPVVQVLKGSCLAVDSAFADCRNEVLSTECYGGAFYVAGDGCALILSNVTVMGCSASLAGGGVYVGNGAALSIVGDTMVVGNTSGYGNAVDDDICLESGDVEFTVGPRSDPAAEPGSVGVRYQTSDVTGGNHLGDKVATYVGDVSGITNAVASLFCDVDSDLRADWAGDGATLLWSLPGEDRRLPDETDAVVHVGDGAAKGYYASLEDALAQVKDKATVVLLADVVISNDVTVGSSVTISSTNTPPCSIGRENGALLRVTAGGDLTVTNVTLNGSSGTAGLIRVFGGSLTLDDGATVTGNVGSADRSSGAVVVFGGGAFTMKSGARIADCGNDYRDDSDGTGRGGALLVDGGTANLLGGEIVRCRANNGGVFIGNGSTVNVGGDIKIVDNVGLDGVTPCNLEVYDNASEVGWVNLTGKLTDDASIGYTAGVSADKDVFGKVSAAALSDADMVASAHRFVRDSDGAVGMVVKNGGECLLVWSTALDDAGNLKVDDKTYALVKGSEIQIAQPVKTGDYVYDGTEKTGVGEGVGYVLSGAVKATDAGTYTATATLRPGYAWNGGAFVPCEIEWSIAKKVYDLSGISFKDTEFVYDGKGHALMLTGELPEGVVVQYTSNCGTNVTEEPVEVVATFTVDEAHKGNFELRDGEGNPVESVELKAKYTIVAKAIDLLPIAFKSIAKVDETTWSLVITDRVATCYYRLLSTADLAQGFTTTGAWEKAEANGEWVTNVTTEAGASLFWQAEATEKVEEDK